MKNTLAAAYLALLISLGAAWWPRPESSLPEPAPGSKAPAEPAASAAPTPAPDEEEAARLPAAAETITLLQGDKLLELDMQEYLKGVLAAEMPAYFEPEALKAQAVAARSYALYCAETNRHSSADVCADYRCCQAWYSRESLESSWGGSFKEYYAAIEAAVEQTRGQYLCYEGQAIFAAFHASSCGYTADCAQVWDSLPYLLSVESPEDATSVPDYVSQVEVSALDFRDTLLSELPWADFSGPESEWIGPLDRDASGRVSCAWLGGAAFDGVRIKELFSLRSAAFTLEYTGSSFLFTVTGHGHGVGMSQHGANLMAARGTGYEQILAHYYPGTVLAGKS